MKSLKSVYTHKNGGTISFFIGISIGACLMWLFIPSAVPEVIKPLRIDNKDTPLIRPLLAYDTPEMKVSGPLKNDLQDIIDTAVANHSAKEVSVYFRGLNSGKWFAINQEETFVPASLFKVPLMIAYLKDAESNPYLLSKMYINDLSHDANSNETIKPLKTIVIGNSYSVDQLLHYMIEYSDNNATELLFKHINQTTLKQVFDDLDIPTEQTGQDFISVTTYSFLFRVLYNGTYLSHEMSQKGLEMLSKIDFEDGIRKSVPKTVTVADKFGEYFTIQNLDVSNKQLHDCGIVYHPKHPYILCIMTKGDSFNDLKKVIQSVSKTVYERVDAVK